MYTMYNRVNLCQGSVAHTYTQQIGGHPVPPSPITPCTCIPCMIGSVIAMDQWLILTCSKLVGTHPPSPIIPCTCIPCTLYNRVNLYYRSVAHTYTQQTPHAIVNTPQLHLRQRCPLDSLGSWCWSDSGFLKQQ